MPTPTESSRLVHNLRTRRFLPSLTSKGLAQRAMQDEESDCLDLFGVRPSRLGRRWPSQRTGRRRRRARRRRRGILLGPPRSDRSRAVRPRPLQPRGVGNAGRNQPRRFRSRVPGRSASLARRRYWTLRGRRPDPRNLNRSNADDGVRRRLGNDPDHATAAVEVAPEPVPLLAGAGERPRVRRAADPQVPPRRTRPFQALARRSEYSAPGPRARPCARRRPFRPVRE
jgi:hypothetical protein